MAQTTKPGPMIFVAVSDTQAAVIRVVGRANFNSSVHFKTVVNELRQRSYRRFILDLTECITMDSTFLGVLAGLALNKTTLGADGSPLDLQLLNPNQRVTDLLENLGVGHLFKLCELPKMNGDFKPAEENTPATKEELNRTCLEAHQLLMEVNPDNVPKFKEVTQFLAEDLNKVKPS